ncbi:MAG: class I SAM-dependent methyltransferase [Oscillospiraceae bacterium]|nr:class I SAM-dependent methyltransferase [Oscillospiraceae bacterium]
MLSLDFPDDYFDCVFAYHVINHTDSTGIKKTISEIERVLKPNGEVFLSFTSKLSDFYLTPDVEKVDENTIICNEEPEIGVPHYYADLHDIIALLHNFNIESVSQREYCDVNNPDNPIKNFHYYASATLTSAH